jgi:fructokinase
MYIVSTFEHSVKLETAVTAVEMKGIPKEKILAVPLDNRNEDRMLFDRMHYSDSISMFDVPMITAAIFGLLGLIYGFLLTWGPVLWGIIGTGVGGGLVHRGRVIEGRNAIAGEWGHNPLPWSRDDEHPGPACFCGHAGCIETWLSGPGMLRDHRAHGGPASSTHDIVAGAKRGEAACEATLARYEERLARALAHVINIVDPDVIVLGGGLSNVDRWYVSVPQLWGAWVFSDRVETRLVRHAHGDSSGVRGAAWLD